MYPYTRFPQSSPTSLQPQLQHIEQATTLRGVGQDKSAPKCDRVASVQPASQKTMARQREMDSNIPRSQILLLQKSSSTLAENLLLFLLTRCYYVAHAKTNPFQETKNGCCLVVGKAGGQGGN